MGKIKDLPPSERPREKAQRYGVSSLSNEELLALVISSGTRKYSALEIAHLIIQENRGLYASSLLAFEQFLSYEGISKAIASKLVAVFELTKRINISKFEIKDDESDEIQFLKSKYQQKIGGASQEVFVVISLDSKRRIIKEKELYIGTRKRTLVSIREVISELLLSKAAYFYLVHNHPGESLEPSDSDILLTQEVIIKSKQLGIEMIDHLIVSNRGFYSFKEGISSISDNFECNC